jgi:ParB family transcriptional regulator, chromosome partitioning protein
VSDKNRLGKGLASIFGEDVSSVLEDIQRGASDEYSSVKTLLKVSEIRPNPFQPRRFFDEDKLAELAESIKQHGLFTPVLVRESIQGYELVAGERRLRACKLAKLKEIDAIIVDFDDAQMMEIAIVENIQREDLNVIEEAQGYNLLIKNLGLTQEEVAGRVNKSRSHITNILRLLRLPDEVQSMVATNKLTMGHVRPLITLKDKNDIIYYANEIYARKLSVREAENLINRIDSVPPAKPSKEVRKEYAYVQKLFEDKLQTRIVVEDKKVTISFSDDDDLNRIMEVLGLID